MAPFKLSKYTIAENNNVLVIGGNNEEKLKSYILPNILENNSNIIIQDVDGEIFNVTAQNLKERGYEVQIINFKDKLKSNNYNPFNFISSKQELEEFIDELLKITTIEYPRYGEFFTRAENSLIQSIIFYIWTELNRDEKNISKVLYILNLMQPKEDDYEDEFKDPIDILFENLEKKYGENITILKYKEYRGNPPGARKNIIAGAKLRLTNINMLEDIYLNSNEEINFDFYKKALFVIGENKQYNDLQKLLYFQIFKKIEQQSNMFDTKILINNIQAIGRITLLPELLNKSYKYNIAIFIDNIQELRKIYSDEYEKIINNCNSLVVLKTNSISTIDYLVNTYLITRKKIINIKEKQCLILKKYKKPIIRNKIANRKIEKLITNKTYFGDEDFYNIGIHGNKEDLNIDFETNTTNTLEDIEDDKINFEFHFDEF